MFIDVTVCAAVQGLAEYRQSSVAPCLIASPVAKLHYHLTQYCLHFKTPVNRVVVLTSPCHQSIIHRVYCVLVNHYVYTLT
jgi:hypothetical protein